jgi:hypothetical protein
VEKTKNATILQARVWRATNDDDEQYCFAVAL